jgi:hypothetical protein
VGVNKKKNIFFSCALLVIGGAAFSFKLFELFLNTPDFKWYLTTGLIGFSCVFFFIGCFVQNKFIHVSHIVLMLVFLTFSIIDSFQNQSSIVLSVILTTLLFGYELEKSKAMITIVLMSFFFMLLYPASIKHEPIDRMFELIFYCVIIAVFLISSMNKKKEEVEEEPKRRKEKLTTQRRHVSIEKVLAIVFSSNVLTTIITTIINKVFK